MRGERRRNRAAVLLAGVALVAAACALLVVGEARVKSIPGLSVGVFGTFLTSMAIIAAFSIEEGSRWPTPWETLDRANVPIWFVVALGSVVTALLAGAIDSPFLSAFSLTLALAAIPLGTWGLWGLISLSSDQGRWGLVVDLLAESILVAGATPRPSEEPDLGEIETEDHVPESFLGAGAPRRPRRTGVAIERVPEVLRAYADRRNLGAIIGLVDEVHAGACLALDRDRWVDAESYLRSVDTVLSTQRAIFSELAGRVLAGQLGDATSRLALTRAGEATIDIAGRARSHGPEPGRDRGRLETLAVRHLTALCRSAGQMTQEAEQLLRSSLIPLPGRGRGEARAAMLALRSACFELQQAVRWAIDPDPPGMKIPPDHAWRDGLADPDAALVWLWSAAESASGPFGVGLYAVCEILTGKKFFESYWDGFDVFTEIARRLELGSPETAAGREALERVGGLELAALELGARRLAATPPREDGSPGFEGDPADRDPRHVACNLFLAGGGFKPPGRDPVADLAWLLTDRLEGSLWTAVFDQLAELPDAVLSPPLQPLHRHAPACALAICLRLARLDDGESEDGGELERFVAGLPGPLFEKTAALAAGQIAGASPAGGERGDRERELIAAAGSARAVTPRPLPRPPLIHAAPRPPRAKLVGGPAADGFSAALEAIRGASGELEVDLVQCDQRWLEEWAPLRAELDAALLTAALRGDARVRRVVPYDLPRDSARRATRLQYRWTESLTTAVRCFPPSDPGAPSRYQVRRLILAELGGPAPPPEDLIEVRAGGLAAARFEDLWSGLDRESGALDRPGLIELWPS